MMIPSGVDAGLRLARFCKALGHPVRVIIIRFLEAQRDAATCGDIARQLPIAQSTVSEHLRVLKNAGLIEAKDAPPRVLYRINAETLDAFRREASQL